MFNLRARRGRSPEGPAGLGQSAGPQQSGGAPSSGRAENLSDLPNTPPIAKADSNEIKLFAELFGDPLVTNSRLWVALFIALCVIACMALAISAMLPLKSIALKIVEVDKETGAVVRISSAPDYTPTAAMVKAKLNEWAEQMTVIDPYVTRENLRKSTALLKGKAVSEHADWLKEQNQFKRMLDNPQLVRTYKLTSIDVSKPNIAFLFFTTTERGAGEPKIVRWRLTVHYVSAPPTTEEDLLRNPVGLGLSHFEFSPEIAS